MTYDADCPDPPQITNSASAPGVGADGTDSWLLDDVPTTTWSDAEVSVPPPLRLGEEEGVRPRPSAVEDVFRLDYDREIAYLVHAGKILPGLAPKKVRRS